MEGSQATGAPPECRVGWRTAAIRTRLAELVGEPLVGEIHQLSGGASRETYLCACASRGELVLQTEHAGKPSGEPPGQVALLQAAARAGVPVPSVVAHGSDDPLLGAAWTLVEALAGTTDPKQIIDAATVNGAPTLIDSVAHALALVHRMPADPLLAPLVEDPLAQLRSLYTRLGEPHPTFEVAFRALGADRPSQRRTLVHGDFRMGNLMVAGDRVTGVLDWELAHIGAPAEDLGWLCVPAWRFGRPDLPAAGLGTRDQLLAAYARHSGVAVPMAELRRWELAGTLRWGVICVMQAFSHLSGTRRSIEHAVIGRRACEVEWDLLELLDPQGPAAAHPPAHRNDVPPGPAGMHDRPSAVELLEAARGALGEHVLPLLEGRSAFELRVTLRALGIVRRELEHAEAHAAIHAAALATLGVADERELAAAIRDGGLDNRDTELLPALRAIVRAKLEVANPGYLQTTENASAEEGT
jgi:aminoglycoside phosphotransferase (APT) family kinase protein